MKPDPSFQRLRDVPRAAPRWLAEAERHWTTLAPALATGHWDARTTRFRFSQFLLELAEVPAQLVAFLNARIDEALAAGDARAVERLAVHVRGHSSVLRYRTRPAVAALLALLAAAGGGARKAAPDLVVTRVRAYPRAALAKLTGVRRQQFLVAAGKYLGGRYATPAAFFAKLAADPDEPAPDVALWAIAPAAAPTRPTHLLWTFLVDNGTVFAATSAVALVGMTQGKLAPLARTPAARDLAADLQRVARF